MKTTWVFVLLFACGVASAGSSLEDLRVDLTPFLQKGCKQLPNQPPGYPPSLDCKGLQPKEKFTGMSFDAVRNDLGGLSPALPMIESTMSRKETKAPGIRTIGCLLPIVLQYVVYTKGEIQIIDTPDKFRSYFAPVESDAEAYSFAVALSESFPMHKINLPAGMRVEAPNTPPTFVKKVKEGYLVHLFSKDLCGCGPHWVYSVDYLVTPDGFVKESSRQKFYADPKEDNLCVD